MGTLRPVETGVWRSHQVHDEDVWGVWGARGDAVGNSRVGRYIPIDLVQLACGYTRS